MILTKWFLFLFVGLVKNMPAWNRTLYEKLPSSALTPGDETYFYFTIFEENGEPIDILDFSKYISFIFWQKGYNNKKKYIAVNYTIKKTENLKYLVNFIAPKIISRKKSEIIYLRGKLMNKIFYGKILNYTIITQNNEKDKTEIISQKFPSTKINKNTIINATTYNKTKPRISHIKYPPTNSKITKSYYPTIGDKKEASEKDKKLNNNTKEPQKDKVVDNYTTMKGLFYIIIFILNRSETAIPETLRKDPDLFGNYPTNSIYLLYNYDMLMCAMLKKKM